MCPEAGKLSFAAAQRPRRGSAKGSPRAAPAPRRPEEAARPRRLPPGNSQRRCPGGAAEAEGEELAPAVCRRYRHRSARLAESLCQAGSVLVLHERKKGGAGGGGSELEGKGGGEGEGGEVALIHCNTDQIQCSNLSFKATDLQITSLTAALLCTKLENAQNSWSSAVRMQPAALVYRAGRPRSRSRGSGRPQRIGTGRAGSPGSLCSPLGPGAQPVRRGRGEPGGPKAARSQPGRGVAAPAPLAPLAGSSRELPSTAVPAEPRRLWGGVGPGARRRPAAPLSLLLRYRLSGTSEPPLPPPVKPRPPRLPRRRAIRPRAPSSPSVSLSFFPSHSVLLLSHTVRPCPCPLSPSLTLSCLCPCPALLLFLSLSPFCLCFSFCPILILPLPFPCTVLSLPRDSTPSSPSPSYPLPSRGPGAVRSAPPHVRQLPPHPPGGSEEGQACARGLEVSPSHEARPARTSI